MATHSSTLAWKIPWAEEPGRLQSMGSLRVRRDWVTSLSLFLPSKEISTHSSVLAWRIPGTGEPGGLHTVHGVSKRLTRLSDFTLTLINCEKAHLIWSKIYEPCRQLTQRCLFILGKPDLKALLCRFWKMHGSKRLNLLGLRLLWVISDSKSTSPVWGSNKQPSNITQESSFSWDSPQNMA